MREYGPPIGPMNRAAMTTQSTTTRATARANSRTSRRCGISGSMSSLSASWVAAPEAVRTGLGGEAHAVTSPASITVIKAIVESTKAPRVDRSTIHPFALAPSRLKDSVRSEGPAAAGHQPLLGSDLTAPIWHHLSGATCRATIVVPDQPAQATPRRGRSALVPRAWPRPRRKTRRRSQWCLQGSSCRPRLPRLWAVRSAFVPPCSVKHEPGSHTPCSASVPPCSQPCSASCARWTRDGRQVPSLPPLLKMVSDLRKRQSPRWESNPRRSHYECDPLPTEVHGRAGQIRPVQRSRGRSARRLDPQE